MRALIDCDVLIDIALERDEWLAESVAVLAWAEQNPSAGWIAWHSLANVHYISRRLRGDEAARDFLREILGFLEVPAAGHAAARQALDLPMVDFEDALQSMCAITAQADLIVTRNTADYRRSPVPAVAPKEFLRRVRP
jgi:predicted nucleic acid-binding protein